MTVEPHRKPPDLPQRQRASDTRERDERAIRAHVDALLDAALADTFPASDPVALLVPAS
ncbi:MAG TPA: hypothetical protein VLV76_26035 [Candidatus Acidoferrum sp.]|nr:hypothetical protein [Candidatus Acidoferrum sp.]